MNKIKILAIVGSLRKDSLNKQLALYAKEMLEDKVNFSLLDYAGVPFFNQDIEFPAPPSVKRVREKIKSADAIWFFSPEYNHYFPGVLKNLLDWLSRPISDVEPQVLAGKPTAVSGIALGMSGTAVAQDHLVGLISLLNMDVMNFPRLTIPNAFQQMNGNKLVLKDSFPFLQNQANEFLRFVKKRLDC